MSAVIDPDETMVVCPMCGHNTHHHDIEKMWREIRIALSVQWNDMLSAALAEIAPSHPLIAAWELARDGEDR